MAPSKRYLRISNKTVLETHIYTDPPSLHHTWLYNPRNPILPKVIEHIRPAVIPKIQKVRDEDIWNRKKKPISKKPEVLSTDEFEVSITLIPTDDRHSILTKHKHLSNRAAYKPFATTKGLVASAAEAPIDVDGLPDAPRNESTEIAVIIPPEDLDDNVVVFTAPEPPSKRPRPSSSTPPTGAPADQDRDPSDATSEASGLFVPSDAESNGNSDEEFQFMGGDDREGNPAKRTRQTTLTGDEKKKLKMDVSYEGFAIYGHILVLVIRKAGTKKRGGRAETGVIEGWLASQLPVGNDEG